MAERSSDRPPSVSSSLTEAEAYDDNEKGAALSPTEGSYVKLKSPEEMDIGDDVERVGLLPADAEDEKPPQAKQDNSTRTAILWMVVNTLATIGIVSSFKVWQFQELMAEFLRSLQTRPSSRIHP